MCVMNGCGSLSRLGALFPAIWYLEIILLLRGREQPPDLGISGPVGPCVSGAFGRVRTKRETAWEGRDMTF
jgi:hypothetical protein